MRSVFRLCRSSALFSLIFASYLWQIALCKLFGSRFQSRWEVVHQRNARRLATGFTNLRGIYIKLGQVLSVMGTFLPNAYADELEVLQDQVPPRPVKKIRNAIVKSLGKSIDEIFDSFDDQAVAAASLGQVHRAVIGGQDVAVKVLYPGIRKTIAIDLRVLKWTLWFYKRFVPAKRLGRIHEQIGDLMKRETNLLHEADCLKKMTANFSGDERVAFPSLAADWPVSEDVLVMSFEAGVKINDMASYERLGLDAKEVATLLADLFSHQFYGHRFFHADPHPGNILVRPGTDGPCIVFLDLGSATVMPEHFAHGMAYLIRGVMSENDEDVLKAITTIGFAGDDNEVVRVQVTKYFRALVGLEAASQKELTNEVKTRLEAGGMSRKSIRELMKNVEYPNDWLYVERSVIILFGLLMNLSPGLNFFQLGAKHVFPLLAEIQNKKVA